jgi:hypothetical protein
MVLNCPEEFRFGVLSRRIAEAFPYAVHFPTPAERRILG